MTFTPIEDRHTYVIRELSVALVDRPGLVSSRRQQVPDAIGAAARLLYADRLRLPTEDEARDAIALDLALSLGRVS